MRGPLGVVLGGGLLALTLAAPTVLADSGRVVFSGAVLEPTCRVNQRQIDAVLALPRASAGAVQRLSCGAVPGAAGRSYSSMVVRLDAAGVGVDRLLARFAGYVDAAAAAPATVVVRTYE